MNLCPAEQSKEIIDRGGSANQAMLGGLAAGATEVLLEKIPVSQLLSIRDVKTAKSMLGATVKQMGLEASDEMLGELAYLITDAIVMEDNSYFRSQTAQYELLGLSPEAAQRKALKDCVGRVALAGGTGAVEGGLKGGAWAAGSYAGGKISSQLPNPWTSGSVDSFDPMDYDGNYQIGQWQYRPDPALYREYKAVYNNPNFFNQETGAVVYPGTNGDRNIDGFTGGRYEVQTLQPGAIIDRYGSNGTGHYYSPVGTSYEARALPPFMKREPYAQYRVVVPFKVRTGETAPWFEEPGRGMQFLSEYDVETLKKLGIIEEIMRRFPV